MKASTAQLLVAFFAASARAGGADCTSVALTVIPVCAQQCFMSGGPTIGCSGVDFECQCKQQAALYAAIENCVASSCAASEFQAVIDGAATVCDCANGGGAAVTPVSSASGSIVPPPVSTASEPPSTASSPPVPTETETATGGGGGGSSYSGGGGTGTTPTQSTPGGGATSSVVPGGAAQSKAELGLAVAALLGLAMLAKL